MLSMPGACGESIRSRIVSGEVNRGSEMWPFGRSLREIVAATSTRRAGSRVDWWTAETGQFERFTPSRLCDRNGFVKETLAGTGATDGNAP
jgi:hypothetical protein